MTGSPPPRREGDIFFVSDIHLDPARPARARAFLEFLSGLQAPPRPEALYILGDLFEVWLGRESLRDPFHAPLLAALLELTRGGTRVTVLQGNRDFLLQDEFARETGAAVVEDGLAIALGRRRAYLCHGDRLLLPDDALHLRLRWVLRSALGRAVAAALPERAVRLTARFLRGRSRARGRRAWVRFEIRPEIAARIFRGGYDLVIAGHLHREERRAMILEERERELLTLGAWEERGSLLRFDGERLEFSAYPIGSDEEAPAASNR